MLFCLVLGMVRTSNQTNGTNNILPVPEVSGAEDCVEWLPSSETKATQMPSCMNFIDYPIPSSFENKTRRRGGVNVLQADYLAEQGVKSTAPSACSLFFKTAVNQLVLPPTFYLMKCFLVLVCSRFNVTNIFQLAKMERWCECAQVYVLLLLSRTIFKAAIPPSLIRNVRLVELVCHHVLFIAKCSLRFWRKRTFFPIPSRVQRVQHRIIPQE
jgi:hypothetical protein